MKTEAFNYTLPESLIALHPPAERDGGRLMVLDRETDGIRHASIRELPGILPRDALLIINDSKVIKARLRGRRPSGGRVEVLVVSLAPIGENRCRVEALLKANRPVRPGDVIELTGLRATVRSRGERGAAELMVDDSLSGFREHIDQNGEVPLPPYIRRETVPEDEERYQTVYAVRDGSVAAPTAGLHFTDALLGEIRGTGVEIASVTLHVGPGTFRPVVADEIDAHQMDEERYRLEEETVYRILQAKSKGRPVVAVGTTVTRALEGAYQRAGRLVAGEGGTDLFIKPGFDFSVIDGLFTNFHLPRSTLLCLVSALTGRERIMAAYQEAIAKRYRFYSYGDAMLILPRGSR